MVTNNAWNSKNPAQESKGGTNQSEYSKGDILIAQEDDLLQRLPIEDEGDALVVSSGRPSWQPVGTGNVGINLLEITLTSAQMKAINTSPPQLLAAPGVDKAYVVLHCFCKLNAGSEKLTGSSAIGPVYGTTTNRLVESIDSSTFTATVDSTFGASGNGTSNTGDLTSAANNAVLNMWAGSDYGGNASGDATVDVWMWYTTEDL